MLGKEYGQIESATTGRFPDMFAKYMDVANREAQRQSSKMGEQLGSRGALYSGANLKQQSDLRQTMMQDVAAKGAEFQTQLEDQRQKALGQVFQGQAGVAQAEMGGREAAMARVFADFMRRSDVPPWANVIAQTGATRPSGGNVAV
jgi:Skp family chaperone for outer membrane proteins